MIVKIIILRLLGSSDDKEIEKIGVARPKGPPLRLSEEPTLRCLVQEEIEAKSAYRHRLNRRSKKRASVHWPSFVPETMSSAQKKCLQHRFNRWGIGAYHRCNDVSVQEKILSAPVEPVKHRCKASVQPVVTTSAVRSSTATSCYE